MKITVIPLLACLLSACGAPQYPEEPAPKAPATPAPYGLQETIRCAAALSYSSNGLPALGLEHDVYLYADGSALVVCSARGTTQSTWTTLYSAAEYASTRGACVVAYDLDGQGPGQWTFMLGKEAGQPYTVVSYSDSGSPRDGEQLTIRCESTTH